MTKPDRDIIWSNPDLGTTTFFHYDEDGGKDAIVIETVQDAEPILEANKAAFNDAPTGWGDGQRIARIPVVFLEKLIRDGVLDRQLRTLDDAAFRRFLNDPDFQKFRTRPGQV